MRVLLVAAGLCVGANAWGQITTWTFKDNTAVWAATGVTLSGGNQYDKDASAVTSGGVTFTGTSGFVSTAKGIGFNATGSTSNENISIVVPGGYKATVSIYTNTNRSVIASFGSSTQTYNSGWSSSTKEFDNSKGNSDITLYLYCNQNAGGADQSKAPFLESITLIDMTAVASHSWTANAVATINNVKTTIKTYESVSDITESSEYAVVVDKVIVYQGNYYQLADPNFSTNVFGKKYTMGTSNAEHEITYELVENAVFYGEVEDIYKEGKNSAKSTGSTVLSNGEGYYASSSNEAYVTLSFSVPTDGFYNLILGMNNTNSTDRGFNYSIDGADVSETITVTKNSAYVQTIANEYLTAGDHTIRLNKTYSLTPVFDYLLITKTPVITATISSYGYATFSSTSALDFTNVTDATAYIATSKNDDKIVLTSVTGKIAANTGLVLKSTNGGSASVSIPVTDSGTTYNTESETKNYLFAISSNYTLNSSNTGTNYVLTVQGDPEEVVFAPIGNTGAAVTAGQAALWIPTAGTQTRALNIIFDGEATSIAEIERMRNVENENVYNLSGQRISQPTKGLYIVNGKKVIVK